MRQHKTLIAAASLFLAGCAGAALVGQSAPIVNCRIQLDCPNGVAAYVGNLDSETVIVYLQGGPTMDIDTDVLSFAAESGALVLLPFQAQTLPDAPFADHVVDFATAKVAAQNTSDIAAQVIAEAVDTGKNVVVLGVSYGAFVAQQTIVDQGPIADQYIVGVGRLDINELVWRSFARGEPMGFVNGIDIIAVDADGAGMGGETPLIDANMFRLAAGLGYHRYGVLFKNIDLSKVTYFYANQDEQVGALSASEIDVLNERGATVYEVDGDHGAGAEASILEVIRLAGENG